MSIPPNFDIQGHRGCRGLLPENTLNAFQHAVELGVQTLEMDVVVSKDHKVVVSHEAYMNPSICLSAQGKPLSKKEGKALNFYKMDYASIKSYDCGLLQHPKFPEQKPTAAYKPLLADVFEVLKENTTIRYNIELKFDRKKGSEYFPLDSTFADLVIDLLDLYSTSDRCTLQSFDTELLNIIHLKNQNITTAYLIDNRKSLASNLQKLNYLPPILSPRYSLVNERLISQCHDQKMKVIPWTVNKVEDLRNLIHLGVDGIITDYPDRLINLIEEIKNGSFKQSCQ